MIEKSSHRHTWRPLDRLGFRPSSRPVVGLKYPRTCYLMVYTVERLERYKFYILQLFKYVLIRIKNLKT